MLIKLKQLRMIQDYLLNQASSKDHVQAHDLALVLVNEYLEQDGLDKLQPDTIYHMPNTYDVAGEEFFILAEYLAHIMRSEGVDPDLQEAIKAFITADLPVVTLSSYIHTLKTKFNDKAIEDLCRVNSYKDIDLIKSDMSALFDLLQDIIQNDVSESGHCMLLEPTRLLPPEGRPYTHEPFLMRVQDFLQNSLEQGEGQGLLALINYWRGEVLSAKMPFETQIVKQGVVVDRKSTWEHFVDVHPNVVSSASRVDVIAEEVSESVNVQHSKVRGVAPESRLCVLL